MQINEQLNINLYVSVLFPRWEFFNQQRFFFFAALSRGEFRLRRGMFVMLVNFRLGGPPRMSNGITARSAL